MSKDGYLPDGVENHNIPGNRTEDIEFEKYVDDNFNQLADDFMEDNHDMLLDMLNEHPRFHEYLQERFDQAIITRGADEEREEGQM